MGGGFGPSEVSRVSGCRAGTGLGAGIRRTHRELHMRWHHALPILALACGEPIEPSHEYAVTVRAPPHAWTRYSCTVRVRLQRPGGDTGAADSVTLAAGEAKRLSLLVARRGAYTATASLRWEGRPASSWDLAGAWDDVREVEVPGSANVSCP